MLGTVGTVGLPRKMVEWRRLLGRQTEEARPVLRVLLEDRKIRFTPLIETDRRAYAFDGNAGVGGLIAGVIECHGNWRPDREPHGSGRVESVGSVPITGIVSNNRE
jgi:hypothetical protein